MRTLRTLLGLVSILVATRAARAGNCTGDPGSDLARANGSYPHNLPACTLNADNYYNSYLAEDPPAPTGETYFSSIVADFAGTTDNGRLKKLTANRVGDGSTFVMGDDPTDPATNESRSHANLAFYNPNASNGKLLVFLPGHNGAPSKDSHFLIRAAHLGYRAISLAYVNFVSADNCHSAFSPPLSETKGAPYPSADDCITRLLDFKSFGTAIPSAYLPMFNQVLQAEAGATSAGFQDNIGNRLRLLLLWLNTNFPSQGWGQFLMTRCNALFCYSDVNWSKVALGAHSMGGNTAFELARTYAVERLIMVSSPEEFLIQKDGWGAQYVPTYLSNTGATLLSKMYLFCDIYDGACNRAANAFAWGFGRSVGSNGYFWVENGGAFNNAHRMLMSRLPSPIEGCTEHNWIITTCDPTRPFQFTPVWDWMMTNPN